MLRKLSYLVALARERHFGKAAAACNVSQPTLSNAIRRLEEEFQVPIVERGQSFHGLTPEGMRILQFARRLMAEHEGLQQELSILREGLTGQARIGAIPTALPVVAHIMAPFESRFPHATVQVLSRSSREIERGLRDYEIDVGLTYLDNEPIPDVRSVPLYSESYFLLTRRGGPLDEADEVTWAEASELPLCLLTPEMQNRRIVDASFRLAGHAVAPAIETNSLINLYTQVGHGRLSSVIPGPLLTVFSPERELVALPLVDPDVQHMVGLVYPDRTPTTPVAQALTSIVMEEGLPAVLARQMREALVRLKSDAMPSDSQ